MITDSLTVIKIFISTLVSLIPYMLIAIMPAVLVTRNCIRGWRE